MVQDEDGEPACWSWPIPELRDPNQELLESLERYSLVLAQDEKFERRARRLLSSDSRSVFRFVAFHDGRCAVCSDAAELVLDHDHWTGLVRGFLCASCNTAEAGSKLADSRVFSRYRRNPPAAIPHYFESYSGVGPGQLMRRVTQIESEHRWHVQSRVQHRRAQIDVLEQHNSELAAISPRLSKAVRKLVSFRGRLNSEDLEFLEDLDHTFADVLYVVYDCLEIVDEGHSARAAELREMIAYGQSW